MGSMKAAGEKSREKKVSRICAGKSSRKSGIATAHVLLRDSSPGNVLSLRTSWSLWQLNRRGEACDSH